MTCTRIKDPTHTIQFGDLHSETFYNAENKHFPDQDIREVTGMFLCFHEGAALIRYNFDDLPLRLQKEHPPDNNNHCVIPHETLW